MTLLGRSTTLRWYAGNPFGRANHASIRSGMAHLCYVIIDDSNDSSNFPDADKKGDDPDTEDM
jgi:hypothetical protein